MTRRAPGDFDFTFYLESREMCLEVACVLEYEPSGGDGWNEPRYPSRVTLGEAKLGDIDILPALTHDQIAAIEQDALIEHEYWMKDAAELAAIEEYESRRAF